MTSLKTPFLLAALLLAGTAQAGPTIELVNNQPFPIHQPVEVTGLKLEGNWVTSGSQPVQSTANGSVLVASLAGGEKKSLSLTQTKAATTAPDTALTITTNANAAGLIFRSQDLGRLSWDIIVADVRRRSGEAADPPPSTKRDFAAEFKPLPLAFHRSTSGPVFDTWSAEAVKGGLKLAVELVAYQDGFIDVNARLTNESAPRATNVYAAVVCRWEQPGAESRTYCYDNRIRPLPAVAWSGFREAEGRHQFLQRGVDWVQTVFTNGTCASWLNDFAASFTVLAAATAKTPAHYTGANLPQLGQELQSTPGAIYSVTEIARSTVKSFRDRMKENVLPPRGEGVTFSSRLVLEQSAATDRQVDDAFVGYTSWKQQTREGDHFRVAFGTPSVRFGTSYLPYSTLGENFDRLKLPGMDRESFWPLAADTVNQWPLFADDIRRDLRIIKTMGFELIRFHHLELLAPINPKIRQEYLDFLFGELRHLKLKALVDMQAPASEVAALVERYQDVIDSVEIDNEVLIWGIRVDRAEYWKKVYHAVKEAAPNVRVHLTGYNNTGMFNRLQTLGVPFDRVGLHNYIDATDAIPSGRGYALALASMGNKAGKEPVITEWNWRQLTRMTPEARAKIYPGIIEGAIVTRSVPDFYQFQFNETMSPNPRVGRGHILRHYELVHLSRRPKLEAFELEKLIRAYAASESAVRQLDVTHGIVELDKQGRGAGRLELRNNSGKDLTLKPIIETSTDFDAHLVNSNLMHLGAGERQAVEIKVAANDAKPGFYHTFVRFEGGGGMLRYGWLEGRLNGTPKVDTQKILDIDYPGGIAEEMKLNWTGPFVVVYGDDAPVLEVETAVAIAETLESAVGHPVEALPMSAVPLEQREKSGLIAVGTTASNPLVARLAPSKAEVKLVTPPGKPACLLISGNDSQAVEDAGMDFILHYWKLAKDSAAARVGVLEKDLKRGGDASALP